MEKDGRVKSRWEEEIVHLQNTGSVDDDKIVSENEENSGTIILMQLPKE